MPSYPQKKLTHINEKNNPKIVNITQKQSTMRVAVASGTITLSKEAYEAVIHGDGKKGAIIHTAVVAAIMGAKKTSEIIPMCHNISLQGVDIEVFQKDQELKIQACVYSEGKTGVEMEALSAVSIGLLSVYDMLKSIDKNMIIKNIQLESKSGGKNGNFKRGKDL